MKKDTIIKDNLNSKTWTQQEFDELRTLVEINNLTNQTKKPVITYEHNDGTRITKSAGYIPLKRQIEILQETGDRLELMREGIYDYQDDDNINFDATDPTRKQNFDLADASELKRSTDKEIKRIQRDNYLKRIEYLSKLRDKEIDTKVSMGDTINKDKVSQDSGNSKEAEL